MYEQNIEQNDTRKIEKQENISKDRIRIKKAKDTINDDKNDNKLKGIRRNDVKTNDKNWSESCDGEKNSVVDNLPKDKTF